MGILKKDFEIALMRKIRILRDTIKLDPSKQLKGYNFNSDEAVRSTAVAAIMVDCNNGKSVPKEDLPHFMELYFTKELVVAGTYDSIVSHILVQMAYLDFCNSHRMDLH